MLVAHGCVARSARGRSTATLASVAARRQPRAMSGQKAATMCGRALRGLFAGRSIRFGNNVSEGGGNKCVSAPFLPRAADANTAVRDCGCCIPCC